MRGRCRQRFANPVVTDARGEDHGDPFVLRHRGGYFLYHTTDDGDRGISVHRSRDLVHWRFAGIALEPEGWAQTDIWAPEVMDAGGELRMYVSGTTMGPDGEGVEDDRRQGLARAAIRWGRSAGTPRRWSATPGRSTGSPSARPTATGCSTTCRTEATRSTGPPGQRQRGRSAARGGPARGQAGAGRRTPSSLGGRCGGRGRLLERGGLGDRAPRPAAPDVLRRLLPGGHVRHRHRDGPTDPRAVDGRTRPTRSSAAGSASPARATTRWPWRPTASPPYAVYHAYDGVRPGRKVHLDRLFWCGDRPAIAAGRPTEGPQPLHPGPCTTRPCRTGTRSCGSRRARHRLRHRRPPPPGHVRARQDPEGPPRRGRRRAARPRAGRPRPRAPAWAVLTSHLDDDALHALPHAWPWGGRGPVEVSLRRPRRGAAPEMRTCAARATASPCCGACCSGRRRGDPRRGRRRGGPTSSRRRRAQPLSPLRETPSMM